MRFAVTIFLSLSIAACVRRDGRNSDCRWPGESRSHCADARHLSADAEFAEDLAIRYADTHYGLRTPGYVSGEVYDAARDRCMASLFKEIANEHNAAVQVVSAALGRNRAWVDVAIIVPFLLLYCVAALTLARWLWRKYPIAENGWMPGAVMGLFLCLAMATGGTMLGEVWSGIVETYRIGNGHMSYRAERLWCARHRPELFGVEVAVFSLAVAATSRQKGEAGPGGVGPASNEAR